MGFRTTSHEKQEFKWQAFLHIFLYVDNSHGHKVIHTKHSIFNNKININLFKPWTAVGKGILNNTTKRLETWAPNRIIDSHS